MQWETNELLVKYANEGKTVVRLKEETRFFLGEVPKRPRNLGKRV